MTPAHRRYLKEVRRIILRRVRGNSARVYLFGSFATGSIHRASDIDVAVEHTGAVSRAIFTGIRDDLEESRVPYRVDVVDLRSASASLRGRVLASGIPWTA